MADRIVTAGGDDGTPPELLLLAPPDMPMPGWFRRSDGRYERILLPLQRIDWPRFEPAPEEIPDPFAQHLWGPAQLLSWVYLRNRAVVRAASPQDFFERELTRKELRDRGRNGACYRTFEEAEDAVMVELQTGRLPSTGLANDEGDRKEIPSLLWADLEFSEDLISAKPKDFSRTTATVWHKLRFPREDVLAIWRDTLESLAMADEQKASTTADGNANVEPRTHNKRKTEARNRQWQEAIDGLAREHPEQTHTGLCRKLAPRLDVPWQTIRRNTRLGYS